MSFEKPTQAWTSDYRTDGRLFNLRTLQAKTKVRVDKLREFLFADDCALNAESA